MTLTTQSPLRFQAERDPLALLSIPRPIEIVQVQTTATTIVTAGSDQDLHVHHLVAANVTGTADYVTLHIVPSGGSASAANTIVYQKNIGARDFLAVFTGEQIGFLPPSASLVATTGTNDAINVWGFGYDYQGQYTP